MRDTVPSWLLILGGHALLLGCQPAVEVSTPGDGAGQSATARPEIAEALRRDQEAVRHPADGGGEVRFARDPQVATVASAGRWSFVYRAGPLGIQENGWLFLQAPPFWGWSTPQVQFEDAPGYSEVTTTATGVELEPATIDQQLLAIQIRGRALAAGEEIAVEYGAGPDGAIADRYAESRSCFFFAVDGDGDGIRSLVEPPLCVEVAAGDAAQLVLTVPSTAPPGQPVRVRIAALDALGNRAASYSGRVSLEGSNLALVPEVVEFAPEHEGVRAVEVTPAGEGVVRLVARSAEGLEGKSNALLVATGIDRVLWADLHGHSGLSDGTGTPRDYFRYARDVAGLDVVALTDHDHWGMQPLAVHPELWEEIRRETELFHRGGEFVTLLGYEWTSWIHGHRHVLYFVDQGRVLSSVDPDYETPAQLWDALRGEPALTFAHHSAGGPVATNWAFAPDPELEPVTEIVSVHGSSEALQSPSVIYSPVPGNFVRDVLDRGFTLGFVGSGDGHDGHPGLAHLGAPSGGLAAILSEDLSREGVLAALRERRVYATNGPRILLEVRLGDQRMGSVLDADAVAAREPADRDLRVRVVAGAPLERIDLVRSGHEIESIACEGEVCGGRFPLANLQAEEYVYVRALQHDGGAAWSSPYFFR